MTQKEKKLYEELIELRDKIKDITRRKEGRASFVCSDEALEQIVNLKPKKLSDFESVRGIGNIFINNYGNEFLSIIEKYQSSNEKIATMNASVISVMKELEKKLVSINKRNRLISLNNLKNKYAFDMSILGETLVNKILFTTAKVKISDVDKPINGLSKNEENTKLKKIISLLREINKDLREKGQNDLYIGYPFVIGRLPGENFDVHAPLVLFPVVAERTSTTICLQIDDSRDVVYNNTLLLAYYKFNNINDPLPNEEVEVKSKDELICKALNFYSEKGLKIKECFDGLTKFKEYKNDEFPKFNNGELNIELNAILGKFPICSSSIQKDFDQMIKEKKCNELVNDLLETTNHDLYDDSYSGENDERLNDKDLVLSEKDIVYINELNSSQETVLNVIENRNKIVVQGPPGTGKSQTIASLIASYINKDKTVLMVSEKKTALDVVYSRLGILSKYTLLIDDVNNKNSFYDQLLKMIHLADDIDIQDKDLNQISDNIDSQMEKLEIIAQKLYMPNDFGIEPYKLYLLNHKYNYQNSDDRKKYNLFKINWDTKNHLLCAKYLEIKNVSEDFANHVSKLNECIEYIRLSKKYEFLRNMTNDLSEFGIGEFLNHLNDLKISIENWSNKKIITKIFTKGKIKKEIKGMLLKYFTIQTKESINLVLNKIDLVIDSTNYYKEYWEDKNIFEKLNNLEREYIEVVYNVSSTLGCDAQKINKELMNALIFRQIEIFEKNNMEVLSTIKDFDYIIRNICNCIERKQTITKIKLEHILLNHLKTLTNSKRQAEIRRLIESKRKWSVNKFVEKFNFELFKNINIWLLTPEVVSEILPLEPGMFDLVIFDEASQMYVEKGIPSILRGKKVVIAGDHKQLRPSNLGFGRIEVDLDELEEDEEIEAALEEESLLDLARFKYRNILLNFHYRSKYEELIAFSNYAFYKGRLYVSPNVVKPDKPPIEVHHLKDGMWQNRSNMVEAKYVVYLLKIFFQERKNNETIGIITFNSNQRDLIDDLIDEECANNIEFRTQILVEQKRKKDGEDIGIFIKNIESVQGDERDVIIFSIGYAKDVNGRVITRFGWLNQKGGENRLNVAISRAKTKIHIVTSIIPSDLVVESAKNDGPRYFKKYLEYAYAVSMGNSEVAKQVLLSFGDDKNLGNAIQFDSDFENQVYDALVDRGYVVDTQIGIGGYSIDLAIKKEGKYILGIECDGKLYHSSNSARERDIHRQKYLESRGWRIHRIWSPNWWNNPNNEINKICKIVDED